MKLFNKEYDGMDILIWIVVVGAIIIGIVVAVRNPAQPDPECTKEYVELNGATDCDNIYKANDQLQSENTNNYYN